MINFGRVPLLTLAKGDQEPVRKDLLVVVVVAIILLILLIDQYRQSVEVVASLVVLHGLLRRL